MPHRPLDIAVVGNCAVSSLVSPTGRHLWFCFPRPDAEPAFNALLGGTEPERGFFDVTLRNLASSRQAYLPNTAVLETILTDEAGASLRILDLAPRFRRYGRMYRPPSLIRRIEPLSGRPRIRVRLRPTFEYGARMPAISSGSNHIRYIGGLQVLRLTTDAALSHILHETEFGLDRPVNLVLSPDETLPEGVETHVRTCLAETEAYWGDWVRGLNVPFDWQEAVIRAAITLKLCSYEDTGAILAALTTSVPEAPGSARNWDYRFCWLRDAFFTVSALNRLNATRTMEGFVSFVLDAVLSELGDGPVPPLFPIAPGLLGTEEMLAEALPGFHGHGPVRIGNAAVSQRQNDGYGSIVLTASQMFFDTRLPRRGDADLYRQLAGIAARPRALPSSRTPGFGNTGNGSPSTPTRRRCAGRRWTASPASPVASGRRRTPKAGRRRPQPSAAACCARPRCPGRGGSPAPLAGGAWTPPACCCPRSGCCAPTTRSSSAPSR
jgi:GH15 family glucan-1,4-alpha-glucosidase